jgi:hypothetical protein
MRQGLFLALRADADVENVRGQQHTGNHDKPGLEAGGSDRHGGTRDCAENPEPTSSDRSEKGRQPST